MHTSKNNLAIAGGLAVAGALAYFYLHGKGQLPWNKIETPEGVKYGTEPCKNLFRLPPTVLANGQSRTRLHISPSEARLELHNITDGEGALTQTYKRLTPFGSSPIIRGDVRALARSYQLAYAIGELRMLGDSLFGATVGPGSFGYVTHGTTLELSPDSPNLDKVLDGMTRNNLEGWAFGRNGKAYEVREGGIYQVKTHSLKELVRIDWALLDSAYYTDFA